MSESNDKIVITTVAIAITPNMSGASRRVITRLLTRRKAWLRKWASIVQLPADTTRFRNVCAVEDRDRVDWFSKPTIRLARQEQGGHPGYPSPLAARTQITWLHHPMCNGRQWQRQRSTSFA